MKKIYFTLDLKLVSTQNNILGIIGKIQDSYTTEEDIKIPKYQFNKIITSLKSTIENINSQIITRDRKLEVKKEILSDKKMWKIFEELSKLYEEKIIYINKSPRTIHTNLISTNYVILGNVIKFTLYISNEGTKIFYSGSYDYKCNSNGFCSLNKKDLDGVNKQLETIFK